jgi:predicted DNA-binding transcriptional regulator YafY
MRASRLLTILLTLQTRGRASASELADELGVSSRTIHRDIDELTISGVPVYADRGRDGGFRLLDGYRVNLNGLTSLEAEALALANLPGPATDLGLGEAVLTAHLKIIAALPQGQRESAERTMSRFHLDPTGWYQQPDAVPYLPALARAVWSSQQIKIRYRSWKADVQRTADPLGLVLKGGNWYLVARVGTDTRSFRVSNILSMTDTGTTVKPPRAFNLADYWTTSSRSFEKSLYSGKAVLRVSREGFRRLCDMPSLVAAAARASAGHHDRGGWRTVEIPIESIDHAAIELLRLGHNAIVLTPHDLASRIKETARGMTALYQDTRKAKVT